MKEQLIKFGHKNGRYYDLDSYDWEKIIERANNGSLLGEMGSVDSYTRDFDVSLKNVSHSITNVEVNEQGVWGEIELLSTPKGNELKMLTDMGYGFHISARGTGTVNPDGKVIYGKLASFDVIPKVYSVPELRSMKLERIMKKMKDKNG